MARRLLDFPLVAHSKRRVNAAPGPHLYPATVNTRVTLPDLSAPIPPRLPDAVFNTRPSRVRLYVSAGPGSHHILREGFERPILRVPRPRVAATPRGEMLSVRNPAGNMPTPQFTAWGTILDAYARGAIR